MQMFNRLPFQNYKYLTVKSKIINCNTFLQSFGGLKRKPSDSIDTFIESNSKIYNAKFLLLTM